MRALDRKLLRDLARMRGQAVAIALLVACAITTYVGARATYLSLFRSQTEYYDRFRFADAFAQVRRAPEPVADLLARIPGVDEVETRVVAPATLEMPDMDEPATAILVSLPASGQPRMNRLYVRSGRMVAPGNDREALVTEGFAAAHGLMPGDRVDAVVHGRRVTLSIVGVALSPEYVYQVRPGELIPDDRRFGVLWVSRPGLEGAMDMAGAFNDVTFRLSRAASLPAVLAAVDRVLAPYGSAGSHGRDLQHSNRILTLKIEQLRGMAVLIPCVFLGVAAFLLNVVLGRLVSTQRDQIGTMKALGLGTLAIGAHYAEFALLITLAGTALGVTGGWWLGSALTHLYARYYRLPVVAFGLEAPLVAASAALAAGAGLAAVASSVWRAARLPPAEAMRPQAPATFGPSVLERLGLGRVLSTSGRMVLRFLSRHPGRALLSIVGLSLAVSILVAGNFVRDALDVMMDIQFRLAERQDATVTFVENRGGGALQELRQLPGVTAAEGFRTVPAVLSAGTRSYRGAVTGMDPAATLHRVVDAHGHAVPVPPDGVLLSRQLAAMLAVGLGSTIDVQVLDGARPRSALRVTSLVDDLMGAWAYASLPVADAVAGDGERLSGAYLALDPDRRGEAFQALEARPLVAGVALEAVAVESFRATTASTMRVMAAIMALFAAVIAAGVVYNQARVALAERERELATLRVIGFTRSEVARILFGELWTLVVAAIPAGCALGYAMAAWLAVASSTDLVRLPVIVGRETWVFAIGVVTGTAAAVSVVLRRRLDRLDFATVLKTKE